MSVKNTHPTLFRAGAESARPDVRRKSGVIPSILSGDEDGGHAGDLPDLRGRANRHWSAQEIQLLLELVGCDSLETISKRLGRTPTAVRFKLRNLEKSSDEPSGFEVEELMILLRVSPGELQTWQSLGDLQDAAGRITESSLLRFCRKHPERILYNALDAAAQRWLRDSGYPV